MSQDIREGFEVEFECGHKAVYDKYGPHGYPELGQSGNCRQCRGPGDLFADRKVIALRQCWIETTTRVLFEGPENV